MSAQLVIMAGVFGAAAGAFLPLAGRRLAVPYGDPPRAGCEGCGRAFAGWVCAGTPCACRDGWAGPVLCSALAGALLAGSLGPDPRLPVLLPAAVLGVLLAVIDVRCLRLPDPLVAALAVGAGVPLALIRPEQAGVAVAAGVLVGAGYLLVALLPGRGLGLGDVKLGAALAMLLGFGGWPAVGVGFAAAHLLNGTVALWLLIRGRGRDLPFGPALLVGALIGVTAA